MIFDKDRDEVYTYFKAMEEFPALLNLKRGADCKSSTVGHVTTQTRSKQGGTTTSPASIEGFRPCSKLIFERGFFLLKKAQYEI